MEPWGHSWALHGNRDIEKWIAVMVLKKDVDDRIIEEPLRLPLRERRAWVEIYAVEARVPPAVEFSSGSPSNAYIHELHHPPQTNAPPYGRVQGSILKR